LDRYSNDEDFSTDRLNLVQFLFQLFDQPISNINFSPRNIKLKLNSNGKWDGKDLEFISKEVAGPTPGFSAPEQFSDGSGPRTKV